MKLDLVVHETAHLDKQSPLLSAVGTASRRLGVEDEKVMEQMYLKT